MNEQKQAISDMFAAISKIANYRYYRILPAHASYSIGDKISFWLKENSYSRSRKATIINCNNTNDYFTYYLVQDDSGDQYWINSDLYGFRLEY